MDAEDSFWKQQHHSSRLVPAAKILLWTLSVAVLFSPHVLLLWCVGEDQPEPLTWFNADSSKAEDARDDTPGFPSHQSSSSDSDDDFNNYPCTPQHVHLSQAANVKDGTVDVTVSFSLDYRRCATARPHVLYGKWMSEEAQEAESGSRSTTASRHGPLWELGSLVSFPSSPSPLQFNYTSSESHGLYQSPWIYHMTLSNLEAGQQLYAYQIVVETSSSEERPSAAATHRALRSGRVRGEDSMILLGQTERHFFSTPPLPEQPTALALVGDLGQSENSMQTMAHIWRATTNDSPYHDTAVSQLLIAGDLSYADSDPYRWTSWLSKMEPLLRSTTMSVAAGNHEIECDNTTRQIFVPYEHWFRNPNRIAPADLEPVTEAYRRTLWHGSCSAPSEFQGHYWYGNSFYSYQHGLVHIIVLNSYTNATQGSVQYEWLRNELQHAVDRSVTPWLLVMFHAPIYTTFSGHVDEVEALQMRKAMEPLFVQHGVNLIVSGHDHGYMRTTPLAFGQVVENGTAPIYLTLGAGGNREGHAPGYQNATQAEEWVVERNNEEYGYGHLLVVNCSHATFDWIRDGIPVRTNRVMQQAEEELGQPAWFYNPHCIESEAFSSIA